MSAPMVQAILADNKTQTRRLIPSAWFGQEDHEREYPYNLTFPDRDGDYRSAESLCKYGRIGGHLWVRESFYQAGFWEEDETGTRHAWRGSHTIWYAEEEGNKTVRPGSIIRKIPSIHMPRWASRITLEITNIRVERLGDISEADCIAEGLKSWPHEDAFAYGFDGGAPHGYATATGAYAALWEYINGTGSWERDKEKFVWVIEFKRIQP